jgi:hypothetical protein
MTKNARWYQDVTEIILVSMICSIKRRRGHEAKSHIEADPSAGFVSLFQLMHAICHGYYAERPEFGVNASIRQRYAEARGARELTTPGTRGFPLDIRAPRIA